MLAVVHGDDNPEEPTDLGHKRILLRLGHALVRCNRLMPRDALVCTSRMPAVTPRANAKRCGTAFAAARVAPALLSIGCREPPGGVASLLTRGYPLTPRRGW